MLIYTCVPAEQIMDLQEPPEYEIIKISHGIVKAQKTPDGFTVSSILSTNLQDYLNPAYSPGAPITIPEQEHPCNSLF